MLPIDDAMPSLLRAAMEGRARRALRAIFLIRLRAHAYRLFTAHHLLITSSRPRLLRVCVCVCVCVYGEWCVCGVVHETGRGNVSAARRQMSSHPSTPTSPSNRGQVRGLASLLPPPFLSSFPPYHLPPVMRRMPARRCTTSTVTDAAVMRLLRRYLRCDDVYDELLACRWRATRCLFTLLAEIDEDVYVDTTP